MWMYVQCKFYRVTLCSLFIGKTRKFPYMVEPQLFEQMRWWTVFLTPNCSSCCTIIWFLDKLPRSRQNIITLCVSHASFLAQSTPAPNCSDLGGYCVVHSYFYFFYPFFLFIIFLLHQPWDLRNSVKVEKWKEKQNNYRGKETTWKCEIGICVSDLAVKYCLAKYIQVQMNEITFIYNYVLYSGVFIFFCVRFRHFHWFCV